MQKAMLYSNFLKQKAQQAAVRAGVFHLLSVKEENQKFKNIFRP